MSSNFLAKGAKAKGTPAKGVSSPSANMPVKNFGTINVPKGTTKGTKILGSSNGQSAGKASDFDSRKANMPTSNFQDSKVKLGSTHHGVGQVPGYLKSK